MTDFELLDFESLVLNKSWSPCLVALSGFHSCSC